MEMVAIRLNAIERNGELISHCTRVKNGEKIS